MTALDEVWISTQEVARLLQISIDATRRRLNHFETREVEGLGRGGKRLEIRLASLGPEAIDRWQDKISIPMATIGAMADACAAAAAAPRTLPEDRERLTSAFESATNRVREHYQRCFRILSACEGVEGRHSLGLWVDSWNKKHPDDTVAVPTIYRWRAAQREYGLLGLLEREDRTPRTTVRDDWYEWFRGAYLDQGRLSAPMARLVALGKARLAGQEVADDQFPSHWAFMRRLESDLSPSAIEYARQGRKRWYDRHGVHIERDYSQVPAGQVWVGDTHTWDVFVRVGKDPVPQTCYLTLFLDMKSYAAMGWHIHLSAPSAENSMRALKHGVENHGIPTDILVDNGREYKNRDFAGITHGHVINYDEQSTQSLMSVLGIRIRFATPKNARAKIIERNFKEIKDKFSRFWGTFKGGNVIEKPERLKATLKRGDIPLLEEFVAAANQFLSETFPAIPCHGSHHNGLSRGALLEAEMKTPLARATDETLSRLVSRTVTGKVKNRGFYIAALNAWWWAEWMVSKKGETIELRYDPEDLRTAWCYEAKGPFLGTAQLREAINALVDDTDEISKARLANQMHQMRGEEKLLRSMFPQQTTAQSRSNLEALGAAVGSRPLSLPGSGPIRVTDHDHVAAKLKRDRRIQGIDITKLSTPDAPEKTTLRWYDENQFTAAG